MSSPVLKVEQAQIRVLNAFLGTTGDGVLL